MHAPNKDVLLARADAAIETAKRLGMERDRHIAVGYAICSHSRQSKLFLFSLPLPLAIRLVLRQSGNE
jgi:hypothetical protein